MKVYGALESAQIEWFTNAGKPAASSYPYRVIYVTDLKQIQVSDGTNWNPSAVYSYTVATLPAAGASNNNQIAFITDTLQVKVSNGTEWKTIGARLDTFTSGTIPAAASNTNSLIWVSDLQQVQVSNGTSWVQVGSKAGTKNYFSQNNANPDFETNSVTPWSACTLTFSSGVPSGAPTLTATQMAISTTSTTPLAGTYSMLLTKSAANAQYQGFISGALTIDREDTAKVLYGSFNYEVVSGTIDLSGSSTQSLEIWIYNTVSGAWTQPAGYRGMNQSSGVGKVVFSFQTDGTFANNTYKIAVFTQQTSTSSYVVKFDDFAVGPEAIVLGTPVTDFEDKGSMTINATSVAPSKGTVTLDSVLVKRVGDVAQMIYEYYQTTAGASAGTGTYLFSLPAGMAFDTTKITTSGGSVLNGGRSATTPIGYGSISADNTSGNNGNVILIAYNSTQFYAHITSSQTGTGTGGGTVDDPVGSSAYALNVANTGYKFFINAPIAGWSSASQVSSDTDTRIIAARATLTTSKSSASGAVDISGLTIAGDTSSSLDSTTGVYTVPVSGWYRLSGTAYFQNAGGAFYSLYVTDDTNAELVRLGGTQANPAITADTTASGSQIYYFNAGSKFKFRVSRGSTAVVFQGLTNISIERLSGPSVITATESVNASYNITAAASTADVTQFNFDNKQWDSHNAVTVGAGVWKFTAPVSGTYSVSATLYCGGSNTFVGLYIQGSIYRTFSYPLGGTATGAVGTGSTLVQLNAGQYIDVRNITGSARTPATSTGTGSTLANSNYITITRVGN